MEDPAEHEWMPSRCGSMFHRSRAAAIAFARSSFSRNPNVMYRPPERPCPRRSGRSTLYPRAIARRASSSHSEAAPPFPWRKRRVGLCSGSPGEANVATSSTGSSALPACRSSSTRSAAPDSAASSSLRRSAVGPRPVAETSRAASRRDTSQEPATKSAAPPNTTERKRRVTRVKDVRLRHAVRGANLAGLLPEEADHLDGTTDIGLAGEPDRLSLPALPYEG